MDSERIKSQIGNHIAAYRKQSNMTQAELAERLNYSDKAVSKWERGESLPDVMTLIQLAQVLGVSVDHLLKQDETAVSVETPVKEAKRRVNKTVIQLLVSLLVWFVALLVYVVVSSFDVPRSWLSFIYAVPVNAIVLLCLRSAWRKFNLNFLLISTIVWGALVSLYVTVLIFAHYNIWKMFLLGAMGQIAVILWFRMFHPHKEENHG